MSDAVSRDAVMHALQEWTYCCDAEDVVRALPAAQPVTVDQLAQIIRIVDGTHSLGAGELAERILSAVALPAVQPDTVQAQIDAAVLAERERCAVIADAQEARAAAREKEAPDDENDFANGLLFGTKIGARIIAAEIRKGDQPDAHVNETPKSEHEKGDMLTLTKGDA